jgi:hypothetical protein
MATNVDDGRTLRFFRDFLPWNAVHLANLIYVVLEKMLPKTECRIAKLVAKRALQQSHCQTADNVVVHIE